MKMNLTNLNADTILAALPVLLSLAQHLPEIAKLVQEFIAGFDDGDPQQAQIKADIERLMPENDAASARVHAKLRELAQQT